MHGCLDAMGNIKSTKACKRVSGTEGTITKKARPSSVGLQSFVQKHLSTARDFYDLETSAYERIQSVKRPLGCENFKLFPRLISKDDRSMSFVTDRIGSPLEVRALSAFP